MSLASYSLYNPRDQLNSLTPHHTSRKLEKRMKICYANKPMYKIQSIAQRTMHAQCNHHTNAEPLCCTSQLMLNDARASKYTYVIHPVLYFFPFFLVGTTLKAEAVSSLGGPFLATSLQPPPDFSPVLDTGSTTPLSASFLRRRYSSAKWRPSISCELL